MKNEDYKWYPEFLDVEPLSGFLPHSSLDYQAPEDMYEYIGVRPKASEPYIQKDY